MDIFGALFGKVKIQKSGKKFSSIAAAIDAADDGDTILVKPGIYKESFDVHKKVSIIGDAAKKPIIWSETRNPLNVIVISAECVLENLDVRGAKDRCPESTQIEDSKGFFLRMQPSCILAKSSCSLSNVDICYSAGFGIACISEKTVLEMTRCSVHSNRDQAVVIDEGAQALISETRIYNNEESGVCCHKKSNVKLYDCVITECYSGIVCGESVLDAEKCEVSRNNSAGFSLSYGVKVSARNCSINGNKSYGVECESTSVATFLECEISESPYGIYCREGFAMSVQNCNIHDVEKKEIAIVKDTMLSDVQSIKNVSAVTENFVRL